MHGLQEIFMRRALQLAANGFPEAFPNPMVGAVITDSSGKIIGEGWHRRCGEAHAEVNAVNSVKDRSALRDATMYVTLEPCAHYGRTGPCSLLIIREGIPRVVVATRDPFEKVDGKGIEMLRQAGVDVSVGMLEEESRRLNAVFFTAHTKKRPFITLKWAQSADGYMAARRCDGTIVPFAFSTPSTMPLVHRLRAMSDLILVGAGTVLADNPRLDLRLWPGKSPRPVILDRHALVSSDACVMQRDPLIFNGNEPLPDILSELYGMGYTSLLVEGGANVLWKFLDAGLWDAARVEVSGKSLGSSGAVKAPVVDSYSGSLEHNADGNRVMWFSNNPLVSCNGVKNL